MARGKVDHSVLVIIPRDANGAPLCEQPVRVPFAGKPAAGEVPPQRCEVSMFGTGGFGVEQTLPVLYLDVTVEAAP
jgi:hypothetical protein